MMPWLSHSDSQSSMLANQPAHSIHTMCCGCGRRGYDRSQWGVSSRYKPSIDRPTDRLFTQVGAARTTARMTSQFSSARLLLLLLLPLLRKGWQSRDTRTRARHWTYSLSMLAFTPRIHIHATVSRYAVLSIPTP